MELLLNIYAIKSQKKSEFLKNVNFEFNLFSTLKVKSYKNKFKNLFTVKTLNISRKLVCLL